MPEEVDAIIRRRPAIHRLTYGAFLQEHVWTSPQTLVVPLTPMGFGHGAAYACNYQHQIIGTSVHSPAEDELIGHGREALPVLAFIHFAKEQHSPEIMEKEARPDLDRAEQLVGWISGDFIHDFAFLIADFDMIYIRTLPPLSRRRLLLGFGNVGTDLKNNIDNIREAADQDERYAFALSLYRDALHETNKQFKIARLFTVLEGLAYALKSDGMGSRNAVRKMLDLKAGATGEISYGGRSVRYDRIALAGKLRDHLFHGAPFSRNDLEVAFRESFDLLKDRPDDLVDQLMADCELEFARWGNNKSVARTAGEERAKVKN